MQQCSDFDEDCKDIKNHLKCWMGHPGVYSPGEGYIYLPVADGYCPFVDSTKWPAATVTQEEKDE